MLSALGLESTLKRIDGVKKLQSTRKTFRGYCKAVATNLKLYIKPFEDLIKQTGGTNYAAHHLFQDAEMKMLFVESYRRGIGLAMPVLGKYSPRFSPHWIMNQVQRKHRDTKEAPEVARLALRTAGCREEDAEKIAEFVETAFEAFEIFF